MTAAEAPADLLRRAASVAAQFGNPVAPALVAWLRDEAARCAQSQARWEAGPQWLGVGDDDLPPKMTTGQVRDAVEHHWRHELAVARALLGEDQPQSCA